ncbi:hypothetical protein EYF80_040954 [Liparis tanakae]|uniref:Uncharacterized protein n=1 Tax=Liparis tanakae TaxID=230148 RepID=A0A4Z2G6S4_9TELE|nr:hypothetical protein EYF80_040954 [Liparis tanakae]
MFLCTSSMGPGRWEILSLRSSASRARFSCSCLACSDGSADVSAEHTAGPPEMDLAANTNYATTKSIKKSDRGYSSAARERLPGSSVLQGERERGGDEGSSSQGDDRRTQSRSGCGARRSGELAAARRRDGASKATRVITRHRTYDIGLNQEHPNGAKTKMPAVLGEGYWEVNGSYCDETRHSDWPRAGDVCTLCLQYSVCVGGVPHVTTPDVVTSCDTTNGYDHNKLILSLLSAESRHNSEAKKHTSHLLKTTTDT